MSKGHGGKRPNQTGRPPKKDEKKIRIGTLFLSPTEIAQLTERAHDGESLLQTARRLLIDCLKLYPMIAWVGLLMIILTPPDR